MQSHVCFFVCLCHLHRAEEAEQCFNFTQKILSRYFNEIPLCLEIFDRTHKGQDGYCLVASLLTLSLTKKIIYKTREMLLHHSFDH